MEKTIIIEVEGGVVQDVRNLPEGWTYELQDRDNQAECDHESTIMRSDGKYCADCNLNLDEEI